MFTSLVVRRSAQTPYRGLATQAKGRSGLLVKRPEDVVVTFAKRTAMGRARKGQLKDIPVDELLHGLCKVDTLGWQILNPALLEDICVAHGLDFRDGGTGAVKAGIFSEEIIPVEIRGTVISVDDTVRQGVTLESLAALKPAFMENGASTAGNSSGVGDGAALCILTTRARAEKEGWEVVGKYVSSAFVGVEPRYMGISPVAAIPKVLAKTGLQKEDVDVWEINEAFASQFAYCVEQLQVPIEKINPNGGSIALTHPLGMTGTRQVVTGLAELKRRGAEILCTSMCIGSGMGGAAIFVNEAPP
ncbi:hypothetical protein BN946_scf184911.g8 [Trametes cinnabarina]|uniref:Thiolase C-terminal domain-containing protein n=1 Tax=Pycnoporus cinnabarinus TaxID=5643 RepID=A0A060SGI6_PYCCI|nr:hypothetical protein BN946_scf184911.g8 [Trametes cinnabarina]